MALDGGAIFGIAIAIVFILAVFIAWSCVYIVHQAEGIVIERFGRFHRVLQPGLSCIVPCMDSPRIFTWRKMYVDVNKKIRDETITNFRVDLRESLFDFVKQEVYSRDTVQLEVNCFMLYRIVDVRKAIYEVDDLAQAVSDTAQSQLKRIFGGMTFAEALASQEAINESMRAGVSQTYEKWGITVERIELQDLRPKPTSNTATAMKKQMVAERSRRSEFIQAEGNKAAMKLKSEGAKIVKTNLGIAEQEATRKRSEGEAAAKVEIARAEKTSLDTIAEAIESDGCSQTDFMIGKKYNELLRGASANASSKTVYMPYEVSAMSGLVASLPTVYGRKSASTPTAPLQGAGAVSTHNRVAARPAVVGSGSINHAFSDLN